MLVFFCLVFALTRRALPGVRLTENRRPLLQDPELRLAALIILAVTLIFLQSGILGKPEVEKV